MCVILQIRTFGAPEKAPAYPQHQVEKLGIKHGPHGEVYTHLVQIVIHNGG